MAYATLADVRAEGITDTMMSDARVNAALIQASTFIDKVTGRWFEPRQRTFRLRGKGHDTLFIRQPIISVSAVNKLSGRGSSISRDVITIDDLIVYNRHLTEGLQDPDDRNNPKLVFEGPETGYPGLQAYFFEGNQNYEVTGYFGYTELGEGVTPGETSDGSQVPTNQGITPPAIKQCCIMLVAREIGLIGDPATRSDWRDGNMLIEEKTADQSYKKANPGTGIGGISGAWTGDPAIDSILAHYLAPAWSSAV